MAQQPDPSTHADTAIAVIGMAVRVPGAPDIQRSWSNLAAGGESIAIGDAAKDRVAAAGVLRAHLQVALAGADRPRAA